jgi:hypothetical protein
VKVEPDLKSARALDSLPRNEPKRFDVIVAVCLKYRLVSKLRTWSGLDLWCFGW